MLKFLLILFLIIYIIGYLAKFFLARWIRKMSDMQNPEKFSRKKEGEVTVNQVKQAKSRYKDEGEYVDFEELDE
jgi:hypothetical protein